MSSPAVSLYAWMKNTKPAYFHDGCKLTFRYAEIIITTVRNSPTKVMLEFETSIPFVDSSKSFALHLVEEWSVKTGLFLVLFYAYSNSKNRYTIVVTPRSKPKSSRHHRSKGTKVPKNEERIHFVTASTSQEQPSVHQQSSMKDQLNNKQQISSGESDVQDFLSDSESVVESGIFSEPSVEVHNQADGGVPNVIRTTTFDGKSVKVPILVTSKTCQTNLAPLVDRPMLKARRTLKTELVHIKRVDTPKPTYAKVVKGATINLNYESDDFKDKISMSNFSKNDVFERARLQLAFFRHERDVNVNLMSYVSNKIYLINSGVAASNENDLERLYFKFCEEKGLSIEEVKMDLKNTENAIRTKRLNYLNAARKSFFEFYCTDRSRSDVIVKQPHNVSIGRCDPELCTLM